MRGSASHPQSWLRTIRRWWKAGGRFNTKCWKIKVLYVQTLFLSASSVVLLRLYPSRFIPRKGSWREEPYFIAQTRDADSEQLMSSRQGTLLNKADVYQLECKITPEWIERSIKAVSKLSPWNQKCRHHAFQAVRLSTHYRIPYTVYVGTNKSSVTRNEIHMWVKTGNQFLSGRCDETHYVQL